ncbi:MAG: glycosyltransferase family 10 [Lachnospiraceae bacterium]|nr:glycosyltransferase family 10 [Lachnospiraceae bacterium]
MILNPNKSYNKYISNIRKIHNKYREDKFYIPSHIGTELEKHDCPIVYNKEGNRMYTCFMAYDHPFENGNQIMFDYSDWGLNVHFYGESELNRIVGNPKIRLAFLGESQLIVKNQYDYVIENQFEIENNFDYIFTFDERILNEFKNAKYFPYPSTPWYGKKYGCKDNQYEFKEKNISIIASNKSLTRLHRLRVEVAKRCKEEGLADAYGKFDGGEFLDNYDDAFRNYRYAIVIENNVSDYYFTEKITSCFAAQTVPIYLGARRIGDFFNENGIITVPENKPELIYEILSNCCYEDYISRKDAIIDNYNRVKLYNGRWNWWFRNYGDIIEKAYG